MDLWLRKKSKLLKIVIISIVIVFVFQCLICPIYTKSLFKPLAKKSLFPDYTGSDIDHIKQLYGELYFDCYENSNSIVVAFALDFTTDVYLKIYKTSSECEEAFWYYVDDYRDGFVLENTDEFTVFVSRKDFSVLNFETEQLLFVRNGNTLYNISKYSFSFSQKDFKNSVLLLDQSGKTEENQSGDGSVIDD